jgi:hypothetical protein
VAHGRGRASTLSTDGSSAGRPPGLLRLELLDQVPDDPHQSEDVCGQLVDFMRGGVVAARGARQDPELRFKAGEVAPDLVGIQRVHMQTLRVLSDRQLYLHNTSVTT